METAPKSQMNVSTFPVEKLGWLLIFIMAVFLAFAIYPSAQLDNDMSRFAAIESLVERGTWIIDESPFLMKPPAANALQHRLLTGWSWRGIPTRPNLRS